MNCTFCRIVAGKLPAEIVYEDQQVMAFLDANPLNPGHTLVIPKAHVESLSELPEEACGPLLSTAVRVARAAREALGAAGVNLVVNDGRAAGQAIPHLHLHVIPRFPGDGGGSFHSLLAVKHHLDLSETARKLRETLREGPAIGGQ